jgi:hypothetical protein
MKECSLLAGEQEQRASFVAESFWSLFVSFFKSE